MGELGRATATRARRLSLVGAVLLASLQGALLASTALDKLDTKDEPYYLATAVRLWLEPGSPRGCDAPALPRWGFALALRIADPILFEEPARVGRDPLWSRPPDISRRNLLAARAVSILVTVAGGLFLWLAALRFGRGAALVTHALWCLSPAVLAQGSLATLDGWAAAFLCVAVWATARAAEKPDAARLLTLGATLGLAAATKVPAVGYVPIAVVVVAWVAARSDSRVARWRTPVRVVALVGLALVITLAGVHGFRLARIDLGDPCGRAAQPVGRLIGPLPFAPWIAGVIQQWRHGQGGHWSYLFGEASGRGWWWFYLAALALKTTLGAQALALLRLVAWVKARPARRELLVDAAMLAYPLLLLLVMSLGNTQNGLRYVLPAFPLLMLWGGRAVPDVGRAFGRRGLVALGLALVLGAVEMLSVHPHHLMFFNRWAGGPTGGPRYLINGDDWGQDLRRVVDWQRRHPRGRFFYTAYTENPRHWGLAFEAPPCEPRQGFYFLQAVEVHRPKRIAPGCLDWLTVAPPDERLGYSIYFYAVDRERMERLERESGTGPPFWRSGGRAVAPEDAD